MMSHIFLMNFVHYMFERPSKFRTNLFSVIGIIWILFAGWYGLFVHSLDHNHNPGETSVHEFGLISFLIISTIVYLSLFYGYTGSVYYDPEDPYQGYGSRFGGYVQFQPLEKLRFGLNISYVDFFRESDKQKIYDYAIIRSRNTFQINKYLFLRAILEYNSYQDRLTLDTLISFTYIPGTVIYAGYGSAFEKLEWDGFDYRESTHFHETKRGFFFKVSYLWRF